MPTVASYSVQSTDLEVTYDVRGSNNMEITIGGAAVILRFAYRFTNVTGGLGLSETHGPKILNLNNEAIDAVSVQSAHAGSPASVIIIGTT